MKGGRDRQRER